MTYTGLSEVCRALLEPLESPSLQLVVLMQRFDFGISMLQTFEIKRSTISTCISLNSNPCCHRRLQDWKSSSQNARTVQVLGRLFPISYCLCERDHSFCQQNRRTRRSHLARKIMSGRLARAL